MKAVDERHTTKSGSMQESPEVTGICRCGRCGNTEQFIGFDDHGYPGGDACECGRRICECQVTLRQPFRVNASGQVTYEASTGGEDGAEMGAYDRIQCARCGAQIWPAKPKAPQHPDLDVTANPQGSSPTELGTAGNRPVGRQFRRKTRTRNSSSLLGGKRP
jgi:hypothetical protein